MGAHQTHPPRCFSARKAERRRGFHFCKETIMHERICNHLLIAGRRDATREMLAYARRAVQRAHAKGYVVLVGGAPKGVEMAVVGECRRLKARVIVAGIANFPRNYGCKHGTFVKIERDLYRTMGGDLLNAPSVRDCWLVDQAQVCLFIWDGVSPGTKAGYDYAVLRGREAHLINFDRRPVPCARTSVRRMSGN
jgi:hypothetical protein